MSADVVTASRTESCPAADGGHRLVRWWAVRGPAVASLVIAHGYAEHGGRYERVGAQLAAAGIVTWTIDHLGHGASAGERASVPDLDVLVRDLGALLDRARAAHRGLPSFVVGHSMGGLVATALGLERQRDLAGLVLSGPAVGDPAGIEPLLDLDPLPEVVLSSELLSRDPRVAEDYDRDPLNYRGPFRRETLRALTSGARRVRERFAELALPLLVLHGGDDQLVVPQASEDLYAGASSRDKELAIYPGLRHEILNEPEGPEITARIAGWVRERAR
ncbi:MAG: lysophospholipase [Thermodesulfobacteriota bacterium]